MHVHPFLHKLLGTVIHKKRINVLGEVVEALIKTKQMELTALGRSLALPIQERSGIRKVDRLLGNPFFQGRNLIIYDAITKLVIGNKARPRIAVDWSKLPNVNEYVLKAALMSEGRGITLYEEVHPKKKEGNKIVHRNFLKQLRCLLPPDCKPIIVTDAGFKNPWFKEVLKLGWDFIGRVRGMTHYNDGTGYFPCKKLYSKAGRVPRYVGEMTLAKKNPLLMFFYMIKEQRKGRKSYDKSGKVRKDKDSRNYSRSYREPWLLVSSLSGYSAEDKVIKIYKRRMTIEENFRDTKSSQYGLGMDGNKTKKRERLSVWLLLAALGSLLAWMIGYIAEKLGLHYEFQANTIRHRRVLSFFYLGCQIIRKKIKIPININRFEFDDGGIYASEN